ncbi:MAG: methylated-DNA--[protein]-cysteine S-methyltransferase, partial [Rhizomicrobium sp.]
MRRYWDRIETPFGQFAAWVDEKGRLVRFHLRAQGADQVDRGAERDVKRLETVRRQVEEYAGGRRRVFELELAAEGGAFSRSVWKALLDIPFGHTSSYGDLARRIGFPKAARAVGAANAANPIALVVPCHRVIGSDGSLTGYGGGLPLKRKLLEHEARVAQGPFDLLS